MHTFVEGEGEQRMRRVQQRTPLGLGEEEQMLVLELVQVHQVQLQFLQSMTN